MDLDDSVYVRKNHSLHSQNNHHIFITRGYIGKVSLYTFYLGIEF